VHDTRLAAAAPARLAARAAHLSPSPTLAVTAEADRLRRTGVDVVDLGAGEPDFPTPKHVKAAAKEAIDRNFTRYTANAGVFELKAAVCARMREDYAVEFAPDEVIVTAGGKQALYNTALALFGPGDEVITHAPVWPTIPEQIKLAGATPVLVRTHAEDGFVIHPDALLGALTPRTRAIIINSPCNPTGALMSESALAVVADAAAARGLWIVIDLCYERLIYEPTPHNLPKVLADRLRDRAVLCGSASKAYAMTGWRCGWAIGPADLIGACNAIQGHSTSNVNSITQKAAIAALSDSQDAVARMLAEYRERRDRLCVWLSEEPRLRCLKPAGAFYLFVDVSDFLSPGGVRTSAEFARALLDRQRVALTAGEAFDAPGFIRISYAAAPHRLKEGAKRLLEFVRDLTPAT
jgi:aspartate aminotransferase